VRQWVIVLLVVMILFVVVAAIFITIGVLATPKGGSEGLSFLSAHLFHWLQWA
jgi:hypothetical protein